MNEMKQNFILQTKRYDDDILKERDLRLCAENAKDRLQARVDALTETVKKLCN